MRLCGGVRELCWTFRLRSGRRWKSNSPRWSKDRCTAKPDAAKSLKGRGQGEARRTRKPKFAELSKEKPAALPTASAMTDLPEPPTTKLLKRGDWRKPGDELTPGFISVITDTRTPRRSPSNGSSGPAHGTGEVDCLERQPADGTRNGEPALAAPLRLRHRPDVERLRRGGR